MNKMIVRFLAGGVGVVLLAFGAPRLVEVSADLVTLNKVNVWKEIPAKVESFAMGKAAQCGGWLWFLSYPPGSNAFNAVYSYEYAGKHYKADRVWPCPATPVEAKALQNRLDSAAMWGGKTSCYVNTFRPEESVLSRNINCFRRSFQAKVFGVCGGVGLVLLVLSVGCRRKVIQTELLAWDYGHWAETSWIEPWVLLCKQVIIVGFAWAFFGTQLWQVSGRNQPMVFPGDPFVWVRLALLVAMAGLVVNAARILLPWVRGRNCRLKLDSFPCRIGERVRMTIGIDKMLPEGTTAKLELRCQSPWSVQCESPKTPFQVIFAICCDIPWSSMTVQSQETRFFVAFDVPGDLPPSSLTKSVFDGVRWVVLLKIKTPRERYEHSFVMPMTNM